MNKASLIICVTGLAGILAGPSRATPGEEFGLVLVHSDPQGAEVSIDGAFKGNTPLLLSDLPFGEYRARLSHPGCEPKEVDLTIRDRVPMKLDVSLTSNTATLHINSSPPGAEILVNGTHKGTTPSSVDQLPTGKYELLFKLDGYQTHSSEVTLQGGVTERVSVNLTPLPASLKIVSLPEGGRVYIDNEFRGNAPVTVNDFESGSHRVRVEMEGHSVMARDVNLEPGSEVIEEFRLEPNSGRLEVTTVPPGAKVLLDGETVGVTPQAEGTLKTISDALTIPLVSEGKHEIQIVKKGYITHEQIVTVEKEKTLVIHQSLRRLFIPNYRVTTETQVIRGVLVEIEPDGDIRIEVRPGIERTVKSDRIRSHQPLKPE